MSAVKTRVQLTDADRKVICELALANKDLSQEKLTGLAAQTLKDSSELYSRLKNPHCNLSCVK